jgi:DNA-binding MarR family transcriptional regulator
MATTSSISDVAAQLRISVARTARRMRQQAGGELSPTQGAALATLDRHGPLTPSELAARERIQRPTATRLIGRLEGQGLVARTRDPEDGRSTLIALTDAGRALLAEQRTRKNAFLERRLRELAPEDREVLARAAHLLDRMLDEDSA